MADRAVLAAAGVDAEALGPRALDFDALVAGASDAALPPEPVGGDAMAFWLYTSGTTGSPKAAVHCHRTLPACQHYLDVLGVTAADRIFATSKLFFAYALGNALLIPLRARATTYLHPGWPDPAAVAAVMREIRPTLFFSVPTVYARLLHADLPAETFGSARLCVSAGERLPAELYARLAGRGSAWRSSTASAPPRPSSWCSPTGRAGAGPDPRASRCRARRPASWTRRAGRCRTGRRACSGCARPRRPPGTGSGLDHSRRTFVGDWFRTGDVYRREADGGHVHCGREDDFFKVAGQWVAPAAVESVLLRHPGVLDGGVVGAEEAGGLIKPFVFVVPRDPAAEPEALRADVRRFLEGALPPHQRPREIRIVSELPRTATGKLQRFRLRELAQARV